MKATKQPETDSHDRPQFLKARAIGRRFGVCPKTIFRLADAGKIHRHKWSARVVVFEVAEVEAFVAASRIGDTSNAAKNAATA